MSDKDKASDKRYRIILTERQLALVGNAVELMMWTGMGQTYDLAEWITLHGNAVPHGSAFDLYIARRDMVKGALDGMMREVHTLTRGEMMSDAVLELSTLYKAIGHRQWLDCGKPEWGVRSHEPIKCGEEPVPEIERVDDENT